MPRIASLDFLRGLAVLGIVLMNIESFAYPDPWSPYRFGFETPTDQMARFWVYFLAQGKFYNMFALLFGVGFFIFLERLAPRTTGLQALDLYARRLFWLFLIGVAHAYLLWTGDVLYHYAVCGFLLFPFRAMKQRSLLLAIAALALLSAIPSMERVARTAAAQQAATAAAQVAPEERSEAQRRSIERWEARLKPREPDRDVHAPPKATWWAGLQETVDEAELHKGMIYHRGILFRTLMVMLIGIVLYRSGIFSDYRAWRFYWPITLALLALALWMNYDRYQHWTFDYFNPVTSVGRQWLHTFPKELGGVAYILLFNGLFQVLGRSKTPGFISAVGRTALSNYLFQSLLLGLIFYGYGLGQHNLWSRWELPGFVLGIWIVQIVATRLWLRRHEQGPLEALWRKLSLRAWSTH